MKTQTVKISAEKPEAAHLKKAAEVIRSGGVVVFPTDTVYGLAASIFDLGAQKKVYALKGRSYRKPLIVMAPDVRSIEHFVVIDAKTRRLMKEFWPGPLTLILATTPVGRMATGGRADIGVRIPDAPAALRLLSACGIPLTTTSANPSRKPSAKDAATAAAYFDRRVELILDGGRCAIGRESTVVDATSFPYTVVREGCLPSKKLLKFL